MVGYVKSYLVKSCRHLDVDAGDKRRKGKKPAMRAFFVVIRKLPSSEMVIDSVRI